MRENTTAIGNVIIKAEPQNDLEDAKFPTQSQNIRKNDVSFGTADARAKQMTKLIVDIKPDPAFRRVNELRIHRGSCYCGIVKYEFKSRSQVKALFKCTCPNCEKYRDSCLYVKDDNFRVITGEERLTSFRMGEGNVSTYFCSLCGVTCFRKVENAPIKIANILIGICGAHPPLNDSGKLPSPRPSQKLPFFKKQSEETYTVIGVINVHTLQDSTIKYRKVLTWDMTKITWEEMKLMLFVT